MPGDVKQGQGIIVDKGCDQVQVEGTEEHVKKPFDFQNILTSMNNILAPVGAEVSMKKKNARTGEVEDCDQTEAVKVTNFRIQSAAAQHAMQNMSYHERREFLIGHKEKGNALFKEKKFEEACKVYMEAVSALTQGSNEEEKEDAVQNIHVPLVNNLAACFVELGEWRRAAALSNEVLKLDKGNLKAMLRKGRALLHMHEHEEAMNTLQMTVVEAKRVSGDMAVNVSRKAEKLLRHLRKSERLHAKAARSMMKGGFAAGAIYEDKKVRGISDEPIQEGQARVVGSGSTFSSPKAGKYSISDEDSDDSSIWSEEEGDQGTLVAHFGTVGPASGFHFCMRACLERAMGQISEMSKYVSRCIKNTIPCRKSKRHELREKMGRLLQREKLE